MSLDTGSFDLRQGYISENIMQIKHKIPI